MGNQCRFPLDVRQILVILANESSLYEQDYNFKVEKLLMMNQLWILNSKLVQFHSILTKKPFDIFHFIKKTFFFVSLLILKISGWTVRRVKNTQTFPHWQNSMKNHQKINCFEWNTKIERNLTNITDYFLSVKCTDVLHR